MLPEFSILNIADLNGLEEEIVFRDHHRNAYSFAIAIMSGLSSLRLY